MNPTVRKALRYAGYYHIAVGASELMNQQSSAGSIFGTFASLPTISSLAPTDFGSMNLAYVDLALGAAAIWASHHF